MLCARGAAPLARRRRTRRSAARASIGRRPMTAHLRTRTQFAGRPMSERQNGRLDPARLGRRSPCLGSAVRSQSALNVLPREDAGSDPRYRSAQRSCGRSIRVESLRRPCAKANAGTSHRRVLPSPLLDVRHAVPRRRQSPRKSQHRFRPFAACISGADIHARRPRANRLAVNSDALGEAGTGQ